MLRKRYLIVILSVLISNSASIKFKRTVRAIGLPYYKILLSLGWCKESQLYSEQFIWEKVTMHRIFDIYFKSRVTITLVEIELVISNTDVLAYSKYGVDQIEFSASLYLPPKTLAVFYNLRIYSCQKSTAHYESEVTTVASDSDYYEDE